VPQVSPFLRDLGNSRARYIPCFPATDTPLLLSWSLAQAQSSVRFYGAGDLFLRLLAIGASHRSQVSQNRRDLGHPILAWGNPGLADYADQVARKPARAAPRRFYKPAATARSPLRFAGDSAIRATPTITSATTPTNSRRSIILRYACSAITVP
jgi:hypothetical protein